ncbi:MAG: 30S ribosomal protein S11 [Candidatus Harrisonbacteria bacterium CG10_big_fil_rev_8_21_14_0_10_42_17]|uniref:Small ribosomal subunit protein uS11 n=1 Tax=Candidatus Harrisonbacteria bacterium CG10_big_fil_rev_8_21_14_0_10_42_17 TaxID=1974584 RepID=A0A2M6WHV3_9BACT|nr:MAG: 30S ribosomal protein S11 [Candidatus Harrisonbacteria bacterium CG10_big_fil_rev_8_21_14_0_10_42_17]
MGKKKIVKQTKEEALKERDELEAAMTRTSGKTVSKRIERGRVYIATSYNNTMITITNERGDVVTWNSAGALGFSGPKKATPFAASKVVAAIAEKIKKSGPFTVDVFIRGIGGGRDSALRSLANHGFEIMSIKDATPIPHNGPKPKKARRV